MADEPKQLSMHAALGIPEAPPRPIDRDWRGCYLPGVKNHGHKRNNSACRGPGSRGGVYWLYSRADHYPPEELERITQDAVERAINGDDMARRFLASALFGPTVEPLPNHRRRKAVSVSPVSTVESILASHK
jgi:hypothetical protein